MKARKVKGLNPDGTLAENAERILAMRLKELQSFSPAVMDPAEVEALHDMRIAAKRVRYVLELAKPAHAPEAAKQARTAKKLQDLLGQIHDCDEMLPRVREHEAVGTTAHLAARRETLHAKFRKTWRKLQETGELSRPPAPADPTAGGAP